MWLIVYEQLSPSLQKWVDEQRGDFRIRFDAGKGGWGAEFKSSDGARSGMVAP